MQGVNLATFQVNDALNAAKIGFSAETLLSQVNLPSRDLFDLLSELAVGASVQVPALSLGVGNTIELSTILGLSDMTVNPKDIIKDNVRVCLCV